MAVVSLASNISSLKAQRKLGDATASITKSYERLASGMRINKASDDAAGLSIALQLNSKSRVYNQAIRNVNDGFSAANIAEGALDSLKNISERQLELAEQAANGSYSSAQRASLNSEANKLVDEFNRIVATTTFNGMSLLDPSLSAMVIQAGYGTTGTLSIDLTSKMRRAVGDGTFTSGQTMALSHAPYPTNLNGWVQSGDLNGDGKLDVVTADYNSGVVRIAIGNGDGTFSTSSVGGGFIDFGSIALGDFTGDGRLDIIVSQIFGPATTSILVGNGNGTFLSASNINVGGNGVYDISVADFNNDGKLDFITAEPFQDQASVYLGNGNGTFQAGISLAATNPQNIRIADFNNDGKVDLLTTDYNFNALHLQLGNGNGTFRAEVTVATVAQGGAAVAIGDFDGDGNSDFAYADYNSGSSVLALGNGNGTFKAPKYFNLGAGMASMLTGDFNGDGKLDLVALETHTGALPSSVLTLFGNGDGSFAAAKTSSSAGWSGAMTTGDFNGDGRTDLAIGVYDNGYQTHQTQILIGNGGYSNHINYLNLNSQSGARSALDTVTATLNRIETQIGAIGGTTSRFQTALATLQVQSENFLAAASRIQDADIALESSNLVRQQVLQQAAVAVLAQANQSPQIALSLLRG